jgi:hypothetical protein
MQEQRALAVRATEMLERMESLPKQKAVRECEYVPKMRRPNLRGLTVCEYVPIMGKIGTYSRFEEDCSRECTQGLTTTSLLRVERSRAFNQTHASTGGQESVRYEAFTS